MPLFGVRSGTFKLNTKFFHYISNFNSYKNPMVLLNKSLGFSSKSKKFAANNNGTRQIDKNIESILRV
jgi:hypothetical protein